MNMLELQVLILTSGVPQPSASPGHFDAPNVEADFQPPISDDAPAPESGLMRSTGLVPRSS
jgi:hypothetical protein